MRRSQLAQPGGRELLAEERIHVSLESGPSLASVLFTKETSGTKAEGGAEERGRKNQFTVPRARGQSLE